MGDEAIDVLEALKRLAGAGADKRIIKAQLIGHALGHPYTAPGGTDMVKILDRAEEMADAILARVGL